jgi:hypothetical protein
LRLHEMMLYPDDGEIRLPEGRMKTGVLQSHR